MTNRAEFERLLDVYGFRCERFGQDLSTHARAQVVSAFAALASAPVAGQAVALELRGVPETIKEGGGFWRSCTGCHELNEGRDTGPYSAVLGCHLGQGCGECGGIGAIWDSTDYQTMADDMARDLGQSVSVAPLASAPVAGEAVTNEMIQAGAKAAREYFERTGGNDPAVIYRAMRAAAPAAPQASECECSRKSKAVSDSEAQL